MTQNLKYIKVHPENIGIDELILPLGSFSMIIKHGKYYLLFNGTDYELSKVEYCEIEAMLAALSGMINRKQK